MFQKQYKPFKFSIAMKKALILSAAAIALLACQKQETPAINGAEKVTIQLGVIGDDTKVATATATTYDSTVKSITYYLYNGSVLEQTVTGQTSGTTEVTVSKVPYTVYAVLNATVSAPANAAAIGATTFDLANLSSTSGIPMYGSATVDFKIATTCNVPVKRAIAKVEIQKVTNALAAPYATSDITITGIYVSNATSTTTLAGTATQTFGYNKLGVLGTDAAYALSAGTLSGAATHSAAYTCAQTLYLCPNTSTNDVYEGEWSARYSRVVLKATIEGATYYYNVNIPTPEAGNHYLISEAKITKLGTQNPDEKLEDAAVTLSFTIEPWTVVNLGTSGVVTW